MAITTGTLLLGKYRVEAIVSRGGMGVVVRAHHLLLDEPVAIKLLDLESPGQEATVVRFVREAAAAARLRSEHVVDVHDAGYLPDGMPYLVMEWLDGQDLERLTVGGRMSASLATTLAIQICDVLAEAHVHGIVHRDIKPANLVLTAREDGTPCIKLLDFGIAKIEADLALTGPRAMLGTPSYASPEQLRSSRAVDHRTDLWGLGVVLYELIEGRRPFLAEDFAPLCFQICEEPPLPPQRMPAGLGAIVMRCLSKNPDDRFAHAVDLASALAAWSDDRAAALRLIARMRRVSRADAASRLARGTGRMNDGTRAPE